MGTAALPARDRAVLEFERLTWSALGRRDTAIGDLFGMTPVRYQQVLHAVIDKPEAEAYDPEHVRRLRRLRDARRHERPARGVGFVID